MNIFDTIAAVATPRGKGGVAMIRISGPDAVKNSASVFAPKNKCSLQEIAPRTAVYGDIIMLGSEGSESVIIDDGIAIVYPAPHSFTGEDTVEICCHGGALVTESVLASCFAAGCRPAEAGEFTRRAFVAGKMGLTHAEGLGNLLEAQTMSQLLLSRGGMRGALSERVTSLYDRLGTVLSSIYAKIDFPDEDLNTLSLDEMRKEAISICGELDTLVKTYRTGRAVSEGIKTVICGRTNAGKSSLYNRLVGREAAIVTSKEGTTRDILEQTVSLGGVTLRLCDTAGLRKSDDEIENIGIERTNRALDEAELVLAVFDSQKALDGEQDIEMLDRLKSHEGCVIGILNKCEVGVEGMNSDTVASLRASFENCVEISALTGEGCEKLAELIGSKYIDGSLDLSSDAVVANARQYGAITSAAERIRASISSMERGEALDLCCIGLEEAMSRLGEIDGREVTEDIISRIFSHFCVGK